MPDRWLLLTAVPPCCPLSRSGPDNIADMGGLARRIFQAHCSGMSEAPPNSDYLVGRFFVGLFATGGVALLLAILYEIHSGAIHHRTGGMSVLASDPSGFWADIAIQCFFLVVIVWQAFRFRRYTKR